MGIQINGQTDTISAVDNNFSLAGNVSIGGTLTYEDVTSVDSVGLITARGGLNVGPLTGIAATISANGRIFTNATDFPYKAQGALVSGARAFYANNTNNSSGANYFFYGQNADGAFFTVTTAGKGNFVGNVEVGPLTGIAATISAAGAITGTELSLGDAQKIKLGIGDDLQIYHNGSHSIIEDIGTGNLNLRTNSVIKFVTNGNETLAELTKNDSVKLYHDNEKKFETTSAGLIIHEDTDKTISFTGGIGEIGNVTGFQALNTAGSALVDFGMRANTLRFATGSSERLRIDANGKIITGGYTDFVRGDLQVISGGGGELNIGRFDTTVSQYNDIGHIFFTGNAQSVGHAVASIACYAAEDHYSNIKPTYLTFTTSGRATDPPTPTERLRIGPDGMLSQYGGQTNNSGGNGIAAGAHNLISISDSIEPSGTRTYTFEGLQSGWMTIRGGGYSSAGQSQFSIFHHLGGYMTATSTYNVTQLVNWGSGVSISNTKNAQSYTIQLTNNSSSYTIGVSFSVESNNGTVKVSANA